MIGKRKAMCDNKSGILRYAAGAAADVFAAATLRGA